MRLDKYLKVSRLVRRRTIATELCAQGKVCVNSKEAKASLQVKVEDEISITMGERIIRVKVMEINEHVTKNDASNMYVIL